MKNSIVFSLLFAVSISVAHADVNMEFVPVWHNSASDGGVNHFFAMGKYEVTAGQWAAFVSDGGISHRYSQTDGLFDGWNGSTGNLREPEVKISWYDAAQFCNWMTSGDTMNGAYQFDTTTKAFVKTDRDAAQALHKTVYVIPTINEWNKAGYFNGSYNTYYANGTGVAGSVVGTPPTQDQANYDNTGEGDGSPIWAVGSGAAYGGEEQNGTFDMMGNVWEWTENQNGDKYYITGGAGHHVTAEQWFKYRPEGGGQYSWAADDGTSWVGFRVAALGGEVIPEPGTVVLLGMVGTGAVVLRRWFAI